MDPLNKLYIEITTQCNLRCQMCVQRTWNTAASEMSLDTFRRLMDQVHELPAPPIIHFGGYGEPTFHPNFLDMVRLAKATGARVEMTTNGTLLSPEIAEVLLDLELNRLVVSIDGVTPRSYGDIRVNGSLQQVTTNLRQLFRLKMRHGGRHSEPKVEIAFVAMKSNAADLAELPRLATRVGAWNVKVSNVIPHTPEMEREILYEHSLTACTYRASRWTVDMSLPKFDWDVHTLSALEGVARSRASLTLLHHSLSARNDYCQFVQEGYAVVRSDGQVSPCLSLLHNHPEYIRGRRKQVTHHSFGSITTSSLRAIWESPTYIAFREKLRVFPYSPCTTCGGCERFPFNYEDCSENTFPTCGGCLWAQGFVECP
ncbi:MAG: radical SAM protein [Chloroflexi bacterium]|nr:radical SAM protein [Chloroflexota bacterium]